MPEKEITLTLFVACYNEAENITGTLDTVAEACRQVGITYEIIIVDDASRDNSVDVIRTYQAAHPELPIILHVNADNEGLGHNFVEAAFLGHGTWYRLVCGDNVEPVETLVKIFREVGKAELLIPYRPEEIDRSWFRQFLSTAFTRLVNLASGFNIKYYNGLPLTRRFYVMRWHSNAHGFGYSADLITRLLSRGVSYLEIPVSGRERAAGNSAALTWRNFCSVGHSVATIFIRRLSKMVHGRS